MENTEETLRTKRVKIKKGNSASGIKRYKDIISNGLFMFGLLNRLANIGVDICPYYWVQEETEPCEQPMIKDDAAYSVRYLNLDELKAVCHLKPGEEYDKMMKDVENGHLVIALEKDKTIAAYTFVELNSFNFKGRRFNLKPNEAYLLNMWTFHEFRGKNLAPYLRYQTYKILSDKGIDIKYSITDYFNKSSIKFKQKLNSKPKSLYLAIVLFKKFTWNFTLRRDLTKRR
jgi:hypothetical protein